MHILSLHFGHDGAFSISKGNKLLQHCQLDRFNRIKHQSHLSGNLLYYLRSLNIKFSFVLLNDLNNGYETIDVFNYKRILKNFNLIDNNTNVLRFDQKHNRKHHIYHAYCSRLFHGDNKHYAVLDGGGVMQDHTGEYERETIFDENFHKIKETTMRIGCRYGTITGDLFQTTYEQGWHLCGKTMALSQYGKNFIKNLDHVKLSEDKNNKKCQDFLYSLQKQTEEDILSIMPKENVNYSGGVAQNILANSQFLKYKNFNIDPLCIDSGISLGLLNYFLKGTLEKLNTVYLGPKPNYQEISIFKDFDIIDSNENKVAQILKDNPVALFQGRSEQGQRGLGNRSLLINCFNKDAIEKINKIKNREWYRPFSPSVIDEEANSFFHMQGKKSPHMMYAFQTKINLPNVSAIDGSSRVQTVAKNYNVNYYNLLKASDGILLNTSLNFPGQVLVENLYDLKYMLDYSPLKYAWLPDINKLIIKK